MAINIKGAIVKNNDKWIYDWLEMDATSPKDIETALKEANGAEIEVIINSGGGDLYAGSEIYTLLKDYKGKSTGKIVGIAGSAASVIAMGVNTLKISPTGQIMIHKARIIQSGNHKVFDQWSEILQSHDAGIANAYQLKTGMNQGKLLDLMDKETYLNAKSALELGFVDEIMFDDNLQLSASHGGIPPDVVNKIKNLLVKNEVAAPDKGAFLMPEIGNTTENGADTQPITDIEVKHNENASLEAQGKEFNRIKQKIFGGMLI